MAKIQDNTDRNIPRNSYFLGCFGLSGKAAKKKPPEDRKKTRRWFSWPLLRVKKSDGKTVPIDLGSVPDNRQSKRIGGHEKKVNHSKYCVPDAGVKIGQIPVNSPDQTVHDKTQKKRFETTQNIILEVHENINDVDSPKNDTCRKLFSFGRKIEGRSTTVSLPGSPEKSSQPGRIAIMSHSATFPAPKIKKQVAVEETRDSQRGPESDTLAGVIGMSIIMVTLVIMLVWGKLCAVLCTAAWFYFVPRLKKTATKPKFSVEVHGSNQKEKEYLDLTYEEQKKKVVFEGFLERKHRNIVV